jgi:superfamily I DNA/RNA helicase
LKTFRFFKSWPDDFLIWHHLAPWERDVPDFLLLSPDHRALLVKVSTQGYRNSHPAAQELLFGNDRSILGKEQESLLRAFLERLDPALAACVPALVLFPNIAQQHLLAPQADGGQGSIQWLGQEMLQSGNLPAWYALFSGTRLADMRIDVMRMHFTPESRVPASLTVRPPDNDRRQAGLTDYLLDAQQERAVKDDLELPPEQQSASKDFQVGIVNGVAGSGKTLILLYRLRLLQAYFPAQRFLVLTHNRPLIRDLKSRYRRLTGGLPRTITWETFNGFCRRHWPPGDEFPWVDPLNRGQRDTFIQTAWAGHLAGSSISAASLGSELDWYKDRVPVDRAGYLKADRKGRGFGLTQEQRIRMWDAMMQYQSEIKAAQAMDWGDVPRRMWHFLREGKVSLPLYDVVLIDEAQFFAPIWFDILKRIVKPQSGHLFIAADPTQGFLGRGTSWRSIGIDARQRTHNLRRSYRTTYEILNFATLLYRKRAPTNDADDEILEPDLMNMPRGVLPVLVPVRGAQDEISVVTTEIAALHRSGYPLRDVLVLHAEYGVDALIRSINRQLGEGKAVDPKDSLPGDCVRVTTLNAGTGLESPVVFLVGLNRLFEREQSLRLSEEDAEQLILENTRKLYMAATRAGQRLVITYAGQVPQAIKDLLPQR